MKLLLNIHLHLVSFRFSFTAFSRYELNDEYVSQKLKKKITKGKLHMKCDCIVRTVVKSVCEPILFSFVLEKPPGYNAILKPYFFENNLFCFDYLYTLLWEGAKPPKWFKW